MVELGQEQADPNDFDIRMKVLESSFSLPIVRDEVYNLIVCKDCGTGVPFDWIQRIEWV